MAYVISNIAYNYVYSYIHSVVYYTVYLLYNSSKWLIGEIKMKVSNVNVYGLEESIKASKYPMAVDATKCTEEITDTVKKLGSSNKGEGHDQFLTGITVQFDLTCSNKMWVEAERYRFLYFVSSQSTMHRIAKFNLNVPHFLQDS